ncbi:MAG: HEAT repeat domain-containing protein [Candidatus Omnitrophota bacterium]
MDQRTPAMKFIASAVVFNFTLTSLGITPETFAATGVSTLAGEVSSLTASTLAIPAEFGQVTETVTGDPKAPAFIHIQSAHGNYQAENNIEKLLGYIEKNSSVKTMFLEGAAGKLNPELFRLFPGNPDFNRKVTDKLMQEGYLTGPENFLINQKMDGGGRMAEGEKPLTPSSILHPSSGSMQAFGMEDLDAYKKDREAFIQVAKKEKTAENYLMKLRASIDKRFASKLNKDLLSLVRQEEALGSGTVSFGSWIKTLGEGSKKHLKTDLSDAFYQDQYPSLIRYFRLQAIGSKIDRDKASVEEASFIKELEKRGISKEIIGKFRATSHEPRATGGVERGTWNVGREYSPLRAAFDQAFEKLPKDFSMKAWPNWTLYAQYIILMQEMEGKGLHEETVRLKDMIQTALAQTPEEKEYLTAARKLYLLKRLFSLEMTRSEYEELRNLHISSEELAAGLQTADHRPQQKALPSPVLSQGERDGVRGLQSSVSSLQSVFAKAVEFYETAILRENKMFQNALKKMSETKQQRAVIVTGGFHADGLKKLASSRNCSYIQITPRIAEVSKRDHEIYLRSMLGSRDIKTSQIAALLSLIDRAQRVAVTGIATTKDWARDIRELVLGMINSEPENSGLKSAFAKTIIGSPTLDLARSEVRQEGGLTVVDLLNDPYGTGNEEDTFLQLGDGSLVSVSFKENPFKVGDTYSELERNAANFRAMGLGADEALRKATEVSHSKDPNISRSEVRKVVRESYLVDIVKADGSVATVKLREGGNYTVEFAMHPMPTKKNAMEDYVRSTGLDPKRGIYIGNENQSVDARDGAMSGVKGLTVLGVDADQKGIIPGVRGIGVGVGATERELARLADLPKNKLPLFVGLDIDDTVLGLKKSISGSASKEGLMADRRGIAEALAKLVLRGVQIVFFTDSSSKVAFERIGEPLGKLVGSQLGEKTARIDFYSSLMTTKFHVNVASAGIEQLFDADYGRPFRMNQETKQVILKSLGSIRETAAGMVLEGSLGHYYDSITRDSQGRRVPAESFESIYPNFYKKTPAGNMSFPFIEERDPMDDGSVSVIALAPFASAAWPGNNVSDTEEDSRRQFIRNVLSKAEETGVFHNVRRSEMRGSSSQGMRMNVVVKLPVGENGEAVDIAIREGGEASIDITRADDKREPVTKKTVMEEFLKEFNLEEKNGYFIGALTSSPEDRDGILTGIDGLPVLAVDYDQGQVMDHPQVKKIGAGPGATTVWLQELLLNNGKDPATHPLPEFIGFSVDNVIVGRKPTTADLGGRTMDTEALATDREDTLIALGELIERGVRIGFFADHEGELMKEKVLDPLAKYFNHKKTEPGLLGRKSHFTIPLYANGVITKYGLNFKGKAGEGSGKWNVEKDENYHSSLRLGRKETEKILEILGGVSEDPVSGDIHAEGLLGEYYTERLTEKVVDKNLFREELKTIYPNFRYHLTAGKNVRPPVVEIRDERYDGVLHDDGKVKLDTVAEITVLPILSATMSSGFGDGSRSSFGREDDERRRFFKILVERLRGNHSYHKQAVASPKESPERGDHQLVGQEIATGIKLTQQMLDSVHKLMGVEDLILDQRLPEDRREEATSRALAALKMMHQKLRNIGQTLESIQYQQDLFRDHFGVRPVIMAGGYATRFSSFIHKTAARAGLKKTNIGYTVQGSYRTPGVKPAVVVGEKILGLLVKDEYLAGYDRVKNAFVLDPKIAEFSPGSRKKEVTVQYLDPEKVRSYLGVDPEEVEIFQTTPEGGHGDHLVQVSSILKTRNKKTAYFQVAFGEMSTAIDRSLTNPSLITYLEILGQDAQAVAGGKPSDGKIEGKGNFFFNGDGQQLLLYTDWGIIPHRKKMKGARHDKVWSEFGEKLAVLENKLESLRKGDPKALKGAVQKLREEKDNEYFSISDDGYVLTQELLLAVNKDLKNWKDLDKERQAFIRNHFAVMENGSSGAELLISSNTAIVQADLLYELKTDVDAQYLNGGYADYDPKNGMDDVHLTRMWTVDPKNGETQALAWNLFGMIADRNLKASGASSGSQYQTRFVNVGDTPASIKDSARQREFAEKIRDTEGEPRWVGYRPLTVSEGRAFATISGLLIEGKDNKAKEKLEGLLKNKAYFSGFRHVAQALFARSQDQKWQADLLEVLESIRSQPPFFHDLISTDRPNGWVLSGVVESAIMEAVDAGVVGGNVEALTTDLHYATQIIQLRNRYAEKVRKNGKKREEYLLERLSFLLTESLRNEGGKIEDLLKFRDNFSPEHPTRADMPEAAKEKPQVITITGGTSSGTLWVPVLESLGIRAHAGIKSVVGNTDDGGSTAKLIKTLNDAGFGITPPLGDLMNATSGAMTLDKKIHLMGDGGRISVEKGKNPTFEEMVLPFIHRTIADAGIEAQPLELQPDFFYFARILLAAVRKVDELNREIQNRNETLQEGEKAKLIEVNGQSIRNIYLLGFLVNKGLFAEADEKKKDKPAFGSREAQKKYDQALKEAVDAAGAEQFSVTLSSLDPKTLYAEYEGHTLAIGMPSTDPKTGKPVTAYPNPAVITRGENGTVSVTRPMLKEGEPGRKEVVPGDASRTIGIEEGIEITAEFGGIALQVDGKLWKLDDSDPDNLTFTSDEGNVKIVMPDGTGREWDQATGKVKEGPLFESKAGARVYWVSRFVKKQTNITELINLSKILKIGLLDGFGEFVNILRGGTAPVRLEPNHALLESIRLAKPQDVILIGPGSHFTSIMPHLMVQGMPEALQTARGNGARVILVMNGSFDNETANYSPYELLETLEVTIKERSKNLRLTDMITDIAIAVPDHRIAREKVKEEIEKQVERMLGGGEFNEVFKARSLNSVEDKQKLLWDEAALEEAVRLLSKDAKRKSSLGELAALVKKDKHDPQSRLSKKLREIDEDPSALMPSEVAWLILAALEEKESILKANAAASAMSADRLDEAAAKTVFLDFLGEQTSLSIEQGAEALRELQFFVLLHAMYPQIKFSIRTDVGAASDAAKKSRGGIALMWEEKELIKSRWPELNEHIIKFPTRTVVAKRVAKREQGKFEDRVLFDPKVVAETLAPHIKRSEMRSFTPAERAIVDQAGQTLVNALGQRAKYDVKTGTWTPITETDLLRMKFDMGLVLGSADERVPEEAAELLKLLRLNGSEGMEVITSGKYGPPEKVLLALNKPDGKGGRITEAEYFAAKMAAKGVPVKEKFIEKESISTVENLWKSRAIILKEMPSAKRILLMGMPWMQAKQAGVFVVEFTKQEGKTLAEAGIELVSYTPYIPDIASMSDEKAMAWLKVGLDEASKVKNWPNQNGKDGKPLSAPVPMGSDVENAMKTLSALLTRVEVESQVTNNQGPGLRSEGEASKKSRSEVRMATLGNFDKIGSRQDSSVGDVFPVSGHGKVLLETQGLRPLMLQNARSEVRHSFLKLFFLAGAFAVVLSAPSAKESFPAQFRIEPQVQVRYTAREFGNEIGMTGRIFNNFFPLMDAVNVVLIGEEDAYRLDNDENIVRMSREYQMLPATFSEMAGFALIKGQYHRRMADLITDSLHLPAVSLPVIFLKKKPGGSNLVAFAHELSHLGQVAYPEGRTSLDGYAAIAQEREAFLNSMLVFRLTNPKSTFFDFARAQDGVTKERFPDAAIQRILASNPGSHLETERQMWQAIDVEIGPRQSLDQLSAQELNDLKTRVLKKNASAANVVGQANEPDDASSESSSQEVRTAPPLRDDDFQGIRGGEFADALKRWYSELFETAIVPVERVEMVLGYQRSFAETYQREAKKELMDVVLQLRLGQIQSLIYIGLKKGNGASSIAAEIRPVLRKAAEATSDGSESRKTLLLLSDRAMDVVEVLKKKYEEIQKQGRSEVRLKPAQEKQFNRIEDRKPQTMTVSSLLFPAFAMPDLAHFQFQLMGVDTHVLNAVFAALAVITFTRLNGYLVLYLISGYKRFERSGSELTGEQALKARLSRDARYMALFAGLACGEYLKYFIGELTLGILLFQFTWITALFFLEMSVYRFVFLKFFNFIRSIAGMDRKDASGTKVVPESRSEVRLTEAEFQKAKKELKESLFLDYFLLGESFNGREYNFIYDLRWKRVSRRIAAAETLGRSKDFRAVPILIDALGDSRESVRNAVEAALQEIGGSVATTALNEYSWKERERREVAESNSVSSDDDEDRGYWEGIGGPGGSRSEVRLTPAQEKQFQKAMSDLQPKWWDGRFNDSGVNRKLAAVRILRDKKALPELLAALEHESAFVRKAVAEALAVLKDFTAIPVLTVALDKEKDGAVWFAIAEALWQCGDTKITGRLIAALTDASAYVRSMSAELLGKHKEKNAVSALIDALKDAPTSAARALRDIKDDRLIQLQRYFVWISYGMGSYNALDAEAIQVIKANLERGEETKATYVEEQEQSHLEGEDNSVTDEGWPKGGGPFPGPGTDDRYKVVDVPGELKITIVRSEARSSIRAENGDKADVAPSEVRTETPVVSQVSLANTSSLGTKIRVALGVVEKIVSPLVSSAPAFAEEIKPQLFVGTAHYQQVSVVPSAFATKWPVFGKIISRFATASTERMVIDQRQGIPDAASVLPLVTFALYNARSEVRLALIADASEVAAFEKELAALSAKGALPQNFKVQAFGDENEFVGAFAGFYNSAAPFGKSVALITDRENSVVTQKIGSRKHLLSVVGASDPLKQTASTLLAADKLLNESIWSLGYHFVSVEKLGGLEALMAELTTYVAAQAKVLASA